MCRCLKVSASGYRLGQRLPAGARQRDNQRLAVRIELHEAAGAPWAPVACT